MQAVVVEDYGAVDGQQLDALHPDGRDGDALGGWVGGDGDVGGGGVDAVDAVAAVEAEGQGDAPRAVFVAGELAAGADVGYIVRVGPSSGAVPAVP